MNTHTKMTWLSSLLGLCVIIIAAESYYLWSAQKSQHDNKQLDSTPALSMTSPAAPNPWPDNWDPSVQMKQMQEQMNKLMNQLTSANAAFTQPGFGMAAAMPKISMRDEANKYQVIVEVPKGQKVEINTNVSGNQLTIDGKIKQMNTSRSNDANQQSLSVSQFSQTMQFPEPVKDSDVKIQRNDKQIVITVPKVG